MAKVEGFTLTLEFLEIIQKIFEFFDGDLQKAKDWLSAPNPNLGFIAPIRLIVLGRSKRVLEFIYASESEAQPPEDPDIRIWELVGSLSGAAVVNNGPELQFNETIHVREILPEPWRATTIPHDAGSREKKA